MKAKKSILSLLRGNVPWVVLILLVLAFNIMSPSFISYRNIYNILIQNAYLIVVAFGVTLIMMAGEMDLSVGYQISLIGILTAKALNAGWPVAICVIMACLIGIAICMLNCIIAKKLDLPLLLISLGTMTICQGLSYVISGAYSFYDFPESFRFLGQGYILGVISVPVLIALVCFVVLSIMLNRTYFGRYIYALGSNAEAANLAGINVQCTMLCISAIEGLCIGLSTVLVIGKLGSAQSNVGVGTEFVVLTAVILGGVSIRGGEGKLSGSLAGILILAVLSNGMQLAQMGTYVQYIAKGAIMLFAVSFDVYNLRRRSKAPKLTAKQPSDPVNEQNKS